MRIRLRVGLGKGRSFILRGKDNQNGSGGDVPPVSGFGAFGEGGEAVLVHADAEVSGGGEGGLAGGEEVGDGGGTGAELFDEFGEPTGELAAFGGEGGKPHLPVEPWLEGGDLGRETVGRSGFVAKEDGLPFGAVGAVFEDEFRAADGHDGEEAVTGGKMPRGESFFQGTKEGKGHAGGESGGGEEDGESNGKLDNGSNGAKEAPGNGCPGERDFLRGKEAGPVTVIDEGEGEGGGEEIEVGVVAGERDEGHQGQKRDAGDKAGAGVGDEDGERDEEFGNQGGESGEGLAGDLVGEPGKGIGDRLGEKVVGHGGEVGPSGVAAEEFDEAGAEHEAEDEEPGGYAEKERWDVAAGNGGEQARFFQENDKEAGLEEKGVPLEGEEVLADVDEGEPAEPGEGCGDGSEEAEGEEDGGNEAGEGDEVERGVGRAENPGEGGEGPGGGGAEGLGDAGNQVFGRKNAVGTDESGNLEEKREKGKEVGEAGESGEEPEAKGGVQGRYSDRPIPLGKWDD